MRAITAAAVSGVVALSWMGLSGFRQAIPAPGTAVTVFESGQVRPIAISPNGQRLFAVNTPDARLEVLAIGTDGLRPLFSVPVGLEPVAVAALSDTEVWVVNHISDSVSVVDVSDASNARVVRTLLVGDEPRDIVFAGRNRDIAFITTAHRGQNNPRDPQLTTPGIGRADVWMFDAKMLRKDRSLGGKPLEILTLFTDTPRALAVAPDGRTVYAAGFHTGNRTTTVFEELVPDGGEAEGGLPGPDTDAAGARQPETGLIVQNDGTHWRDELGRVWDGAVRFNLPDTDVFTIDAGVYPPRLHQGQNAAYAGVGTILFNMAVNPVTQRVYVANTDAKNLRRFEGPGARLGRDHTVQGRLYQSRISILSESGVSVRHLNKHIDYDRCCAAIPNDENARSLAQPLGMEVSRDGKWLYVAAFGSAKVGVYRTAELESDSFVPNVRDQIPVSGGGPTGVALDNDRGRLYVMTRFDNGISVIDLRARRETSHLTLYNPEPQSVVDGRRFLYDANHSSSHGDSACGSCHVFGDVDSLAWDLGNPDETTVANPGPFLLGPDIALPSGAIVSMNPHYRALKGPMTTQSLRGMANHGPMHWRGDRTGGNEAQSLQPDSGTFNEVAAFKKFNPAFVGLIGRQSPLTAEEMQAFTDFILQVTYPPNPIRNLDNSLTPLQAEGRALHFGQVSDSAFNCNVCHVLDANGNKEFNVAKPGFFGTDGRSSLRPEPQFFKVPHLRNLYQKVGMFGMPEIPSSIPSDNHFMGDQIRGFGFFHDGSVDTVFRFHGARVFVQRDAGALGANDPGNPGGFPFLPDQPTSDPTNAQGLRMRRAIEQFSLAFDSNLAPIVGQQVTLSRHNAPASLPRVNLLRARADMGECDLIARTRLSGREIGLLYTG